LTQSGPKALDANELALSTLSSHLTHHRCNGGLLGREVFILNNPAGKCLSMAAILTWPVIFSNGSLRECPQTGAVSQEQPLKNGRFIPISGV
jgi:hypothetical protein